MSKGRSSLLLPGTLLLSLPVLAQPGSALAPVITAFHPTQGPAGTEMTLEGSGFSSSLTFVVFGGSAPALATFVSATCMKVVVPRTAASGPFLLISRGGRAKSPGSFTVTQGSAPVIASFTPTEGAAGTVVTLTGTGFGKDASVLFNGAAAPVTYVGPTQLRATVPQGAASGPLTVRQGTGSATSPGAFTVRGGLAITGFSPLQGGAGTVVTLTGTGFGKDASVLFNGNAAPVTYVGPTELRATVPQGATSGPLTVRQGTGSATSSEAFTVQGGLAISGFSPAQGGAGTVVTLTGSGFAPGASVLFNGAAASAVTFVSAARLQATVPAGASSGPLSVLQGSTRAQSQGTFTVQGSPIHLDLTVGGWYLNQSVQTLGRSIPLVAGKKALLRVFVLANADNGAAPKVRATFTGGSPSPWVQTLQAPGKAVPSTISEDSLGGSWNLDVPGSVLAPGGTLKLEVDPEGAVPESDKANNTLTADLDVRRVGPFRTTLIPVTQQGLTGNVEGGGRTLASWAELLRTLYPVADGSGDVDVALGAPYTTQADLDNGSEGWSTLLDELNRKRVADGTGRYCYGVVGVSYSGGIAGLGYVGLPTAIGWDKSGYENVFAHEVGHNFNRQHAPCGVSGDSNWPRDTAHASAQIGVYGLDTRTGTLMSPSGFKDLMSYCDPVWVSDYTYKGVLDWRVSGKASPEEGEPSALPSRQECLLISGHVRHGQLAMDPVYIVSTRPELPQPGQYRIQLKDAQGDTLRELAFGTHAMADAPVEEASFAFAVPLDSQTLAAYQGIRVVTPTGGLLTRKAGPGKLQEPPTATPLKDGRVRVEWNAKAFPTAMLRDPETQEVLAFGRGGRVELKAPGRALEVNLSDGVRSQRTLVDNPS